MNSACANTLRTLHGCAGEAIRKYGTGILPVITILFTVWKAVPRYA